MLRSQKTKFEKLVVKPGSVIQLEVGKADEVSTFSSSLIGSLYILNDYRYIY